jgi:hypothetical protein
MIIVSIRNQMISIEDAYVLGNEIKLLVLTMKRKDTEVSQRFESIRERRVAVDIKNEGISQPTNKKSSSLSSNQPKET